LLPATTGKAAQAFRDRAFPSMLAVSQHYVTMRAAEVKWEVHQLVLFAIRNTASRAARLVASPHAR
jgi:hypothetical protein